MTTSISTESLSNTYTLATDGACNTNHTKASVRVAGWGFLAV